MSMQLTFMVILLQTTLALATPLPDTAPPKPKLPEDGRSEALFACQVLDLCNQVNANYVRPVTRIQLLKTALAGLYEAARLPVPPRLVAEIETTVTDQQLGVLINRVRTEVAGAEDLEGRNPLVICCQAVAHSLDPHSVVVTGEEQRRSLGLEQEGLGVGLEVTEHHGGPFAVVKTVHPGSPAQRAGLRPGDRITRFNGHAMTELTDDLIFRLLNPDPFTMDPLVPSPAAPETIVLTYERPGRPLTTTLTLRTERFQVEYVQGVAREDNHNWNFMADAHGGLAHVRLASLGKGSACELGDALARLQEDGMHGLILDLRWCPGGYLDEAVTVASLFLRDGVIARVKMRVREVEAHECKTPGPFATLPLVVLVNGETSGGAELIAAALQDHHRAIIVGQRTLGKASVQTPLHLNVSQVGLRLTTGTFLRPSGKNLNRFPDSKDDDDWGVHPDGDHECRVSADLSRTLRQWWLLQTLRPGGSMERLPLDDPTGDPQRQAALEALGECLQVTSEKGAR
jgi:carboxyl-terminal processing protease